MENYKEENSLINTFTTTDTNVGTNERIASLLGGAGLIAYGISRKDGVGAILGILGGGLALRGATGHCQVYQNLGMNSSEERAFSSAKSNKKSNNWLTGKVEVTKSVTINKSAEELYKFWRDFENLPQFMKHLESVKNGGGLYSHWKAKAPLGYSVEWDAEVTNEVENRLIEWRSKEGADIPNSGKVEFKPTKNRGTEVKVDMKYQSPGGKLGSIVAWIFGEEPTIQVEEDLKRFKRLMEAGMNLKVEGQPSGRSPQAKKANA